MDKTEWEELKKSVKDIHEAIVGSTSRVGLIEWQRSQDTKIVDLATRITKIEMTKESVISQILNKLWLAAWAAVTGIMASKLGGV